jgi:hypothetical protein
MSAHKAGRTSKRSTSERWKCSKCHHEWRVPIRTDKILRRSCKCSPPLSYLFGPQSGGGKYKSYTKYIGEKKVCHRCEDVMRFRRLPDGSEAYECSCTDSLNRAFKKCD